MGFALLLPHEDVSFERFLKMLKSLGVTYPVREWAVHASLCFGIRRRRELVQFNSIFFQFNLGFINGSAILQSLSSRLKKCV